jgi:hypothetical protein
MIHKFLKKESRGKKTPGYYVCHNKLTSYQLSYYKTSYREIDIKYILIIV